MNSFDRLLEIYPSQYKDAERAHAFLWYHLRKYPRKKTVHLKTVQRYFRKADRKVPGIEELRDAFTRDKAYAVLFSPGSLPDTFGILPGNREWYERNFGVCFENPGILEKAEASILETKSEHPFWFWLSVIGSMASIVGIPLAIVLWATTNT